MRAPSPLRYPGGKTALTSRVAELLRCNGLDRGDYAEPYAGGAGLALSLLYAGHVAELHLNDIDPAIASLWRCILARGDELIGRLQEIELSVDEWQRQRQLYLSGDVSDEMRLALATIYLNRTNRSGIIKSGGVIGGKKQDGPYKMDCRFNAEGLADRIRRISKHADRITFTSHDALHFMTLMDASLPKRSFLYIDPPYYAKGADLYTSFYGNEDHRDLANTILNLRRPWLLTYDNVDPIRKLYAHRRQFEIELQYSAQTKRRSTELAVVSRYLRVPESWEATRVHKGGKASSAPTDTSVVQATAGPAAVVSPT